MPDKCLCHFTLIWIHGTRYLCLKETRYPNICLIRISILNIIRLKLFMSQCSLRIPFVFIKISDVHMKIFITLNKSKNKWDCTKYVVLSKQIWKNIWRCWTRTELYSTSHWTDVLKEKIKLYLLWRFKSLLFFVRSLCTLNFMRHPDMQQ